MDVGLSLYVCLLVSSFGLFLHVVFNYDEELNLYEIHTSPYSYRLVDMEASYPQHDIKEEDAL
jgi:hypothetical protein